MTFHESVQGHLTDFEWRELLTPGTPLYNRWCAQVDVIAGYLRELREAHVPVLFRPYHEINGNWFWWTGRPGKDGSAALYRQIYDRFVRVHHLDNLVWVWNVNAPNPGWPPIADYYPGAEYVDVVTMDNYGEFKQEYYQSVVELAGAKPMALAEVGRLPSLEVLGRQPRWCYFMVWSEWVEGANPLSLLKAVYGAPQTLTRDDPRLTVPMEAIRKATAKNAGDAPAAEPVTPGASGEARALLNQLVSVSGKSVLSGQMNEALQPAAASTAIALATGKEPAIYGADIGGSPESREAVLREALRAHAGHAVISLSWRARRPTDDSPASGSGLLTDYEWSQLLTPGTALNLRWCRQVDEVGETLKALEKAGVAVLWNPYPEANGREYWWAGRKGVNGSAALYRQLFERLVKKNSIHNLIWMWEAVPPSTEGAVAGVPTDFFPGLLYVDALEIRVNRMDPWNPAERPLKGIDLGMPFGVELSGEIPSPDLLSPNAGWAWFMVTPASDSAPRSEALSKLYGDPHVVSRTATAQPPEHKTE